MYLDNYALIDLAKGDASRRDRMIRAFHNGADLMFSPMNAAEIIGPECQGSLDAIRFFLDAIGPHWFPLETDVMAVIAREDSGSTTGDACTADEFMHKLFAALNLTQHGEQRLAGCGKTGHEGHFDIT